MSRRKGHRKAQREVTVPPTIPWLDIVHHGTDNARFPLEWIDLAAVVICSVMNSYPIFIPDTSMAQHEHFRSNVNFIRRTLVRAGMSYASLVVCLWYIDQFILRCRRDKKCTWHPRDLFLASLIVSDKYLADTPWANADWVYCTNYRYTPGYLCMIERRFMQDMDYRLFMSDQTYLHFWHFLDFQLHLAPLLRAPSTQPLLLSYCDMDALTQSLAPIYTKRLHLLLRPYDAMVLLAKTFAFISVVYAAALATILSTAYVVYQATIWAVQHHHVELLQEHAMILAMSRVDMILSPSMYKWMQYSTNIRRVTGTLNP